MPPFVFLFSGAVQAIARIRFRVGSVVPRRAVERAVDATAYRPTLYRLRHDQPPRNLECPGTLYEHQPSRFAGVLFYDLCHCGGSTFGSGVRARGRARGGPRARPGVPPRAPSRKNVPTPNWRAKPNMQHLCKI